MKKTTIQLSEASIKSAIKELNKYKRELSEKATILVQKLVDAGVEIAKQEVLTLGAFDSGELHDSLDGLMYTLRIVAPKDGFPLDTASIIWYGKEPETPYDATSPKHNYAVAGIRPSLNELVFYARRVETS